MKYQSAFLLFFALVLVGENGLATIYMGATNASNTIVPAANAPAAFYYSNIDSSSGTIAPGDGHTYNIGNPAGTSCDKVLNPNCRNITDPLNILASSTATASTGSMYVVVSGHPLSNAAGSPDLVPIASFPGYVSATPYTIGSGTQTLASPTFGTLCQKASAAGIAGLTAAGPNFCLPAVVPHLSILMYINVIYDVDGLGTFNAGDEFSSITLYIQSEIPQTSSFPLAFGVYDFTAFPGDGEVHIRSPAFDGNFPLTDNNVGIQKVRFYYKVGPTPYAGSTAFANIGPTNNSVFFETGLADTFGHLANYYVPNLQNGTGFYFRGAMVDNAGNIGYLSSNDVQNHFATPDQIVGLLAKNGQCFVATAAYGSPMAAQVKMLRQFRDMYLMKNQLGRNFVSWYYHHSPAWAAKISMSDSAREITRFFLYPAVGYSWLAVHWGVWNATAFLITLILFPFLYFRAVRRPQ